MNCQMSGFMFEKEVIGDYDNGGFRWEKRSGNT